MIKKSIIIVIVLLAAGNAFCQEALRFTTVVIPNQPSQVPPGSTGVLNLMVKIENIGTQVHRLLGITVSFNGGEFIQNNSVDLIADEDGNLNTLGDNYSLLSDPNNLLSVTNNQIVFTPNVIMMPLVITSGNSKYIYLSCNVKTYPVTDTALISAYVNQANDINVDAAATPSGSFPLISTNQYTIEVTADHYNRS